MKNWANYAVPTVDFLLTSSYQLASHILILKRNTQFPALGSLDHRLKVVYFLTGNPNQVIIDGSLYLEPRILNLFYDLFWHLPASAHYVPAPPFSRPCRSDSLPLTYQRLPALFPAYGPG